MLMAALYCEGKTGILLCLIEFSTLEIDIAPELTEFYCW
jgi:hypothetical protein